MDSRVQHTIKIKDYSGIQCASQSQQRKISKLKKGDRLNKVYDSDGEPGLFCDMEDLEDTQDIDKYALFDVLPPAYEKSDYEGNESVAGGGDRSNNDSSHTVYVDIP